MKKLLLAFITCICFLNAKSATMTFDFGPSETGFTFNGWAAGGGTIFFDNLANPATFSIDAGTFDFTSFSVAVFSGANNYSVTNNLSQTVNFTGNDGTVVLNWTGITSVTFTRTSGSASAEDFDDFVYNLSTPSCTDPTVPTITGGSMCPSGNVNLGISGTLNSASKWYIYTASCGGTILDSTSSGSFSVSPSTTTTYYIRGEGNCVTPGSCGSATVTVNTLSSITSVTANLSTICEGNQATLTANSVTAGTGATLSWYTGASGTGTFLGTDNPLDHTPSGTTTYYARLAGTCNTVEESTSVTVNTNSSITSVTASLGVVCYGQGDTLTANGVTEGTGATLTWFTGAGGTGSNLGTGNPLNHTPSGTTTYYARLEGTCNTVEESTNVVVNELTNITSDPSDSTICLGSDVQFSTSASGDVVSYKWQYNEGSGWVDISNSDTNNLFISGSGVSGPSSTTLAIQDFELSPQTPVWNYSGTPNRIDSGYSLVSATPSLSPIGIGGSRAWNVRAVSGGNPLVFNNQVFSSTYDSIRLSFKLAAMNLSGSTGGPDDLDYVLVDYSLDNGNSWVSRIRVRGAISNNCSWPYDAATKAHVSYLPASESLFQPTNSGLQLTDGIGTVELDFPGNISQLSIRITPRSSSATDDWLVDNIELKGINFQGANYASGTQFRAIAYGICNNDTTESATLTINAITEITNNPTNATVCRNDSALFIASAVGHMVTYQWQLNSGSGFADISGETNDSLMLHVNNVSMNGNIYRCRVIGTCKLDTSENAILTVNDLPVISSITSSRNPSVNGYAPYQCADLTATATGAGSLTYDWSNAATGSVINVCPTVGTTYELMVTDGNGCIETDTFRQKVIEGNSPYSGRIIMCYNYPRRAPTNIHIYPAQVQQYLNAGATLGACGVVPNKRDFDAFYDDIYRIYPNPAQNQITVEWFSLFNEIVNIDLVDMTGRVVKNIFNGEVIEGNISLTTSDVSNLPAGMYFMRYSSPTDVRINKVQLMR
jgi:hypothetical protein